MRFGRSRNALLLLVEACIDGVCVVLGHDQSRSWLSPLHADEGSYVMSP